MEDNEDQTADSKESNCANSAQANAEMDRTLGWPPRPPTVPEEKAVKQLERLSPRTPGNSVESIKRPSEMAMKQSSLKQESLSTVSKNSKESFQETPHSSMKLSSVKNSSQSNILGRSEESIEKSFDEAMLSSKTGSLTKLSREKRSRTSISSNKSSQYMKSQSEVLNIQPPIHSSEETPPVPFNTPISLSQSSKILAVAFSPDQAQNKSSQIRQSTLIQDSSESSFSESIDCEDSVLSVVSQSDDEPSYVAPMPKWPEHISLMRLAARSCSKAKDGDEIKSETVSTKRGGEIIPDEPSHSPSERFEMVEVVSDFPSSDSLTSKKYSKPMTSSNMKACNAAYLDDAKKQKSISKLRTSLSHEQALSVKHNSPLPSTEQESMKMTNKSINSHSEEFQKKKPATPTDRDVEEQSSLPSRQMLHSDVYSSLIHCPSQSTSQNMVEARKSPKPAESSNDETRTRASKPYSKSLVQNFSSKYLKLMTSTSDEWDVTKSLKSSSLNDNDEYEQPLNPRMSGSHENVSSTDHCESKEEQIMVETSSTQTASNVIHQTSTSQQFGGKELHSPIASHSGEDTEQPTLPTCIDITASTISSKSVESLYKKSKEVTSPTSQTLRGEKETSSSSITPHLAEDTKLPSLRFSNDVVASRKLSKSRKSLSKEDHNATSSKSIHCSSENEISSSLITSCSREFQVEAKLPCIAQSNNSRENNKHSKSIRSLETLQNKTSLTSPTHHYAEKELNNHLLTSHSRVRASNDSLASSSTSKSIESPEKGQNAILRESMHQVTQKELPTSTTSQSHSSEPSLPPENDQIEGKKCDKSIISLSEDAQNGKSTKTSKPCMVGDSSSSSMVLLSQERTSGSKPPSLSLSCESKLSKKSSKSVRSLSRKVETKTSLASRKHVVEKGLSSSSVMSQPRQRISENNLQSLHQLDDPIDINEISKSVKSPLGKKLNAPSSSILAHRDTEKEISNSQMVSCSREGFSENKLPLITVPGVTITSQKSLKSFGSPLEMVQNVTLPESLSNHITTKEPSPSPTITNLQESKIKLPPLHSPNDSINSVKFSYSVRSSEKVQQGASRKSSIVQESQDQFHLPKLTKSEQSSQFHKACGSLDEIANKKSLKSQIPAELSLKYPTSTFPDFSNKRSLHEFSPKDHSSPKQISINAERLDGKDSLKSTKIPTDVNEDSAVSTRLNASHNELTESSPNSHLGNNLSEIPSTYATCSSVACKESSKSKKSLSEISKDIQILSPPNDLKNTLCSSDLKTSGSITSKISSGSVIAPLNFEMNQIHKLYSWSQIRNAFEIPKSPSLVACRGSTESILPDSSDSKSQNYLSSDNVMQDSLQDLPQHLDKIMTFNEKHQIPSENAQRIGINTNLDTYSPLVNAQMPPLEVHQSQSYTSPKSHYPLLNQDQCSLQLFNSNPCQSPVDNERLESGAFKTAPQSPSSLSLNESHFPQLKTNSIKTKSGTALLIYETPPQTPEKRSTEYLRPEITNTLKQNVTSSTQKDELCVAMTKLTKAFLSPTNSPSQSTNTEIQRVISSSCITSLGSKESSMSLKTRITINEAKVTQGTQQDQKPLFQDTLTSQSTTIQCKRSSQDVFSDTDTSHTLEFMTMSYESLGSSSTEHEVSTERKGTTTSISQAALPTNYATHSYSNTEQQLSCFSLSDRGTQSSRHSLKKYITAISPKLSSKNSQVQQLHSIPSTLQSLQSQICSGSVTVTPNKGYKKSLESLSMKPSMQQQLLEPPPEFRSTSANDLRRNIHKLTSKSATSQLPIQKLRSNFSSDTTTITAIECNDITKGVGTPTEHYSSHTLEAVQSQLASSSLIVKLIERKEQSKQLKPIDTHITSLPLQKSLAPISSPDIPSHDSSQNQIVENPEIFKCQESSSTTNSVTNPPALTRQTETTKSTPLLWNKNVSKIGSSRSEPVSMIIHSKTTQSSHSSPMPSTKYSLTSSSPNEKQADKFETMSETIQRMNFPVEAETSQTLLHGSLLHSATHYTIPVGSSSNSIMSAIMRARSRDQQSISPFTESDVSSWSDLSLYRMLGYVDRATSPVIVNAATPISSPTDPNIPMGPGNDEPTEKSDTDKLKSKKDTTMKKVSSHSTSGRKESTHLQENKSPQSQKSKLHKLNVSSNRVTSPASGIEFKHQPLPLSLPHISNSSSASRTESSKPEYRESFSVHYCKNTVNERTTPSVNFSQESTQTLAESTPIVSKIRKMPQPVAKSSLHDLNDSLLIKEDLSLSSTESLKSALSHVSLTTLESQLPLPTSPLQATSPTTKVTPGLPPKRNQRFTSTSSLQTSVSQTTGPTPPLESAERATQSEKTCQEMETQSSPQPNSAVTLVCVTSSKSVMTSPREHSAQVRESTSQPMCYEHMSTTTTRKGSSELQSTPTPRMHRRDVGRRVQLRRRGRRPPAPGEQRRPTRRQRALAREIAAVLHLLTKEEDEVEDAARALEHALRQHERCSGRGWTAEDLVAVRYLFEKQFKSAKMKQGNDDDESEDTGGDEDDDDKNDGDDDNESYDDSQFTDTESGDGYTDASGDDWTDHDEDSREKRCMRELGGTLQAIAEERTSVIQEGSLSGKSTKSTVVSGEVKLQMDYENEVEAVTTGDTVPFRNEKSHVPKLNATRSFEKKENIEAPKLKKTRSFDEKDNREVPKLKTTKSIEAKMNAAMSCKPTQKMDARLKEVKTSLLPKKKVVGADTRARLAPRVAVSLSSGGDERPLPVTTWSVSDKGHLVLTCPLKASPEMKKAPPEAKKTAPISKPRVHKPLSAKHGSERPPSTAKRMRMRLLQQQQQHKQSPALEARGHPTQPPADPNRQHALASSGVTSASMVKSVAGALRRVLQSGCPLATLTAGARPLPPPPLPPQNVSKGALQNALNCLFKKPVVSQRATVKGRPKPSGRAPQRGPKPHVAQRRKDGDRTKKVSAAAKSNKQRSSSRGSHGGRASRDATTKRHTQNARRKQSKSVQPAAPSHPRPACRVCSTTSVTPASSASYDSLCSGFSDSSGGRTRCSTDLKIRQPLRHWAHRAHKVNEKGGIPINHKQLQHKTELSKGATAAHSQDRGKRKWNPRIDIRRNKA